ncbi:IMPACT family protein [Syntrophomonas erecta]
MEFYSIDQAAAAEIEIKKSRFIGRVVPVTNEKQAVQVVEEARQLWPGAIHYCYAWIIRSPHLERCSDDGEPSGTAGLPMLTVLKNQELVNIAAVVVRYFGGTLLGSAGLVRAYMESVRQALAMADRRQYRLVQRFNISLEYNELGLVRHRLLDNPEVATCGVEYGEKVVLQVEVPLNQVDWFIQGINSVTRGQADIQYLGEIYA